MKELSGGATASSRVKFMLKIAVEKVEFDAEQCCLRASGKNVEENEHIRVWLVLHIRDCARPYH